MPRPTKRFKLEHRVKTEDKINIIQVVLFSVIYLQMTKTQL